ncbi:Chitin synthase, class 1 [Boothiomyces sp. JEL0866]|nr:Chitin synthase, class 1 [Boothiomyces sp. JEL0866]
MSNNQQYTQGQYQSGYQPGQYNSAPPQQRYDQIQNGPPQQEYSRYDSDQQYQQYRRQEYVPPPSDFGRFETVKRGPTTMRRVKAHSGNFVMSIPLSKHILQDAEYTTGEEFTHTTYTGVTCEPEEFPEKYHLRARRYNREVKVALVVTMYNEDDDLFTKSMMAVAKNISYLCSKECPFSWGKDGWKNFVVVIVSDGRQKINPRVLTVLSTLGVYIKGLPRASVDGKPVTAHIFESTTQVAVDRQFNIRTRRDGVVPTQIIFVLKEKNAKKINSHKWFFNAICETINPEVCMLLDVGTKPSETAFFHLWRAFDRNPLVGGACGEIRAEIGKVGKNLFNPLVAAQNFEYKMSNILDKPLESVFGYISVLPGAFSAYRYKALLGRPLEQYFLGENPAADIFTSNLYLAEDRILCFELVTKKTEPWVLKYVKSARAETDVPDTLAELVSQRRRWLNGSFFCAIHAELHFMQIYSSPHSFFQKFMFTLEFIYNGINILFAWFQIGNFYLAFKFLFDTKDAETANPALVQTDPFKGFPMFDILNFVYIVTLVSMLIAALGNRPQGSRWLYYLISIFFAIIMGLMVFLGGWSIKVQFDVFSAANQSKDAAAVFKSVLASPTFRDIVVSTLSTYGLYLIASIMHLDPWHCFTSMIQYLFLLPTYINIFMVYSFCNLHDVSWGTKGDNKIEEVGGGVKKVVTADGQEVFEVEVPTDQDEVDAAWKESEKQLMFNKDNKEEKDNTVDEKTKKEDGTKEFRTKVVLFWVICNLTLIAVFTNKLALNIMFPNGESQAGTANYINPYLTFLFWSVAGLSLVRFLGCCAYLTQWWIEKIHDAGVAGPSNNV